ncbi:hypothetical protein D3C81_1880980 [compost metagenome]
MLACGRQFGGGLQAQTFLRVEPVLLQAADGRRLVTGAKALAGLDPGLFPEVGLQPLLPLQALLVQILQSSRGFGAHQLLAQLADLFGAGA